MGLIRAMVIINAASGIPEDASVNTYWFTSVTPATDAAAISTVMQGLYDDYRGLYPATVSQTGHRFKAYDMADDEPRAPIADDTWDFSGSVTGDSLPSEVSLTLSFQGLRQSGTPQSRRRGRVYWGPIKTTYNSSVGRPTSTPITTLASFGTDLLAASSAAADWSWVVYSRRDDLPVSVQSGWVDNSWDTQRRRGLTPTTRTTW